MRRNDAIIFGIRLKISMNARVYVLKKRASDGHGNWICFFNWLTSALGKTLICSRGLFFKTKLHTHKCDSTTVCENTIGSYECRCPLGTWPVPGAKNTSGADLRCHSNNCDFVRPTKKTCTSSTMVILAPIALLCRECYAYYLISWYGIRHCSQFSYLLSTNPERLSRECILHRSRGTKLVCMCL